MKTEELKLEYFFDLILKIQKKYGYKIYFIDESVDTYFVKIAYSDVCSGVAFGGVQYELVFSKNPFKISYLNKIMPRQLRLDIEDTKSVSTLDEAVDFIILDIQKAEEVIKEQERQRALKKLTSRERELLGVQL